MQRVRVAKATDASVFGASGAAPAFRAPSSTAAQQQQQPQQQPQPQQPASAGASRIESVAPPTAQGWKPSISMSSTRGAVPHVSLPTTTTTTKTTINSVPARATTGTNAVVVAAMGSARTFTVSAPHTTRLAALAAALQNLGLQAAPPQPVGSSAAAAAAAAAALQHRHQHTVSCIDAPDAPAHVIISQPSNSTSGSGGGASSSRARCELHAFVYFDMDVLLSHERVAHVAHVRAWRARALTQSQRSHTPTMAAHVVVLVSGGGGGGAHSLATLCDAAGEFNDGELASTPTSTLVVMNFRAAADACAQFHAALFAPHNALDMGNEWQQLSAAVCGKSTALEMLRNAPFAAPDAAAKTLTCSLLQDTFGSIAKIAQLSVQRILDHTPVDRASAESLVAFFDIDV